VLVLGGAGFAAGFFGPMILNPGANQGPMDGIFISGPGGALLGLALGVVFRFVPVGAARQYQVLAVTAAALAIGTLFVCLPEPEVQGVLIQGVVRQCQAPGELADTAVHDWEKRIADTPWGKPRAGWQQEVAGMLSNNTGVVLTIEVQRQDRILRHRKPWDAGRLSAEGWRSTPSTERYFADFAGRSCAGYADQLPTLYVKYGQGSSLWPPDDLPNFLGLARIEEAPSQYLQLSKR
jgi:hypothetical protein